MSGKGSGRRPGANDAAFLKNCPFPSLLERRKAREEEARNRVKELKGDLAAWAERGLDEELG